MAYKFGSADPSTFSNFMTDWQKYATKPAWNSQQITSQNNPTPSAAIAPTNNTSRVSAGSYDMGSGYTMSVNNDGTYSVGSSAVSPITTATTSSTATTAIPTTTTAIPTTTTTAIPTTTTTAVAAPTSTTATPTTVAAPTSTTATPTTTATTPPEVVQLPGASQIVGQPYSSGPVVPLPQQNVGQQLNGTTTDQSGVVQAPPEVVQAVGQPIFGGYFNDQGQLQSTPPTDQSGVVQLPPGAGQIYSGISQLPQNQLPQNFNQQLNGTTTDQSGVVQLPPGAGQIYSGISQLAQNFNQPFSQLNGPVSPSTISQ